MHFPFSPAILHFYIKSLAMGLHPHLQSSQHLMKLAGWSRIQEQCQEKKWKMCPLTKEFDCTIQNLPINSCRIMVLSFAIAKTLPLRHCKHFAPVASFHLYLLFSWWKASVRMIWWKKILAMNTWVFTSSATHLNPPPRNHAPLGTPPPLSTTAKNEHISYGHTVKGSIGLMIYDHFIMCSLFERRNHKMSRGNHKLHSICLVSSFQSQFSNDHTHAANQWIK